MSEKKKQILNIVLKVVLGLLLGGTVVVGSIVIYEKLTDPKGPTVLDPDFELVDPDKNAQTIPGDTGTAPNVSNGGGSMSLIYSDQVSVNLATGEVELFYQNPSESSHSIVVQIIIERGENQYLVAESGAVNRGYMLTELTLDKDTAQILAPGVYEGKMKLLAFDPESGERALVDMNIPVDITVE